MALDGGVAVDVFETGGAPTRGRVRILAGGAAAAVAVAHCPRRWPPAWPIALPK